MTKKQKKQAAVGEIADNRLFRYFCIIALRETAAVFCADLSVELWRFSMQVFHFSSGSFRLQVFGFSRRLQSY